jgi:hypothetical protein
VHAGLTALGKDIIPEMEVHCVLVDLSHASFATARAAVRLAIRPMILSLRTFRDRLVAVVPDERQSNYMSIKLTAKGAAIHAEAIKRAFEREAVLMSAIPVERQKDFVDTLHRVLAKTDELSLRSSKAKAAPAKASRD